MAVNKTSYNQKSKKPEKNREHQKRTPSPQKRKEKQAEKTENQKQPKSPNLFPPKEKGFPQELRSHFWFEPKAGSAITCTMGSPLKGTPAYARKLKQSQQSRAVRRQLAFFGSAKVQKALKDFKLKSQEWGGMSPNGWFLGSTATPKGSQEKRSQPNPKKGHARAHAHTQ